MFANPVPLKSFGGRPRVRGAGCCRKKALEKTLRVASHGVRTAGGPGADAGAGGAQTKVRHHLFGSAPAVRRNPERLLEGLWNEAANAQVRRSSGDKGYGLEPRYQSCQSHDTRGVGAERECRTWMDPSTVDLLTPTRTDGCRAG